MTLIILRFYRVCKPCNKVENLAINGIFKLVQPGSKQAGNFHMGVESFGKFGGS